MGRCGRFPPTSWRSWRRPRRAASAAKPSPWSCPSASRCGLRRHGRRRAARAAGDRGIALPRGARRPRDGRRARAGESGEAVTGDTVISLPLLVGPGIPGLPSDADGFLPTDAHGYARGVERAPAAGDATTFPVKQGGLATQQADAAAAAIAQELGAAIEARAVRAGPAGPRLTGGAPLYRRAELDAEGGLRSGAAPPAPPEGRDLLTGAVAAPRQGRRPLPGAVPRRPLGRRRSATSRSWTGPPAPGAAIQTTATPRSTSPCCVADEDAEAGDLPQALHALDAAAALPGRRAARRVRRTTTALA